MRGVEKITDQASRQGVMMEVINTAIRTELRCQGSKIEIDGDRTIA